MPGPQPDLFGHDAQPDLFGAEPFEAPPEFVARIREELRATLARVQGAEALPWADLTRTTLAELRFRSIAGYLPEGEAAALRQAFEREMERLYAEADGRPPSG
ncbi:MAG: hypothetical protein KDG89_02560 [Geminicoccaceae bacterium]|nr:hypothetical protein [Geminicoccaceae bacterium]